MTGWQIAIETSARQGSVALLRQDALVDQLVLPGQQRTAQSLAPAVAHLMAQIRSASGTVQFVSVGIGPGSFTGLRIGVTAAKTLAYALRRPVVPCDCLQAIIAQTRAAMPGAGAYDAVMNAYRGQVFARRESTAGGVLVDSRLIDQARWADSLGEGALVAAGDIWNQVTWEAENVRLAPPELWTPMAATIGRLGWHAFAAGNALDPLELRPKYLRQSAAEEKKSQP